MIPIGDGRQKFAVADSEFLSILTVTDEGGATFGTVYDDADAAFIAAANPAAITELLDRLEEAESDGLEQARLLGMSGEREAALLSKLEAAEKERDKYKLAYSLWREKTDWVQEGINSGAISPKYLGWHRADVVSDLLKKAEKERDALRTELKETWHRAAAAENTIKSLQAKIEAMEKQKPVGEIQRANSTGNYICSEVWVPLPVGSKLYALPGAQPAPSVPDGFSREDLEAVADGLDGYEKTVNVGNVTGEGDDHLESTTAYAARFIRTMLAAAPEAKP